MWDTPIGRGILLIVYLFIIIVTYIVISSPFEVMVSGFEDVNETASDSYVDFTSGVVRIVFNFCFALAGLIPIIWFIVWVFQREPDWRYYQ